MNRELLNNLYDIYDYLYIYNGYMELMGKFEKDTESCKQKYLRIKNEKINTFPIYLIIIFSAVILFIIGGLVASQINSYVIVYIIIGAVIFAFAAANRYSKKQKKEPEKKAMEFWNSVGSPTCIENNSKIKRIHEELQEFHNENKHVLDFMPEDYRNNIEAVSYMIHAIKNGLADSLKEALNLYIEQKHRWEVEATMRGMARSIEMHNQEIEAYMSEISAQQRMMNSRLADIEMLTFLDYINN